MCVKRCPRLRSALMVLLIGSLAACGGTPTSASSGPDASPELRSVDEERRLARGALVTAADLGRPWVAAKDDPKEAAKEKLDEPCPGQPGVLTIAPPRARATTTFTAGTKPGAAIGSFQVGTLHVGQTQAWREAIATVVEGCRTYRQADGLHVTTTELEKIPPVKGADEVIGLIERIYEGVDHKKLLYVRQYLYTRSGRLVSRAQYAAIQPKSDPTGSDLTEVVGLVSKQTAKATNTFKE